MMTQRQFLDTLLPLQPTLRLVAERLLGNHEEAEDAVQETYARLWEQRQRLEQCENQQGFAMQMLKNHCISLLRKQHPFETMEQLPEVSDENVRHEAEVLEERAATFDRLMSQLPEAQQAAVRMKYLEHKNHEEMQLQLGMSSANVYTTLSRAISNLKSMISHGR